MKHIPSYNNLYLISDITLQNNKPMGPLIAAHLRPLLFEDEVQYFSQKGLGALIMAMHKILQRRLPIVLIGAGLPILPGLPSFAQERLAGLPGQHQDPCDCGT
jgi:hypothetical protein